eukprot:366172-Chlamydomonas_euryale.AAC.4
MDAKSGRGRPGMKEAPWHRPSLAPAMKSNDHIHSSCFSTRMFQFGMLLLEDEAGGAHQLGSSRMRLEGRISWAAWHRAFRPRGFQTQEKQHQEVGFAGSKSLQRGPRKQTGAAVFAKECPGQEAGSLWWSQRGARASKQGHRGGTRTGLATAHAHLRSWHGAHELPDGADEPHTHQAVAAARQQQHPVFVGDEAARRGAWAQAARTVTRPTGDAATARGSTPSHTLRPPREAAHHTTP